MLLPVVMDINLHDRYFLNSSENLNSVEFKLTAIRQDGCVPETLPGLDVIGCLAADASDAVGTIAPDRDPAPVERGFGR